MRNMLIVWLGVASSALVAEARTWTDSTGAYHLDAELLGVTGDKVRLRTAAGRLYSIPLARLSLEDRKLVPWMLTAAGQLGTADNASTGSGSPAGGALSEPASGLQMRQIPAPLPLDIAPLAEPIPSTPEAQSPRPGKRIFSGCDSTFHLDGNNGTGAYWVGGKHYLAKLTWLRTDQNFVYFTGSGEGGVQAWAFLDIESCGRSRVYARMTSGGWRLFDCDFRELPN